MQSDYIPRPDGAFLEWVKNLYAYALAQFPGWSVPSPQTGLETLLNAYDAAYTAAENPNRGKRVYFCLRWESNTNLKGPFGEIYSAVVP